MRGLPAGEIRLFAGTFAPHGWATCDGSLRKVDEDAQLFKVIGTTYGGDGKTTFALPNLQRQLPVHRPNGVKLGQVDKAAAALPPHTAELLYIISLRAYDLPDPFVGEIRTFAFESRMSEWAACEGYLLNISSNTMLFSLLHTTFGGDAARTFALPDLRETVVGKDGLRCVGTNYCIALKGIYPPRG